MDLPVRKKYNRFSGRLKAGGDRNKGIRGGGEVGLMEGM